MKEALYGVLYAVTDTEYAAWMLLGACWDKVFTCIAGVFLGIVAIFILFLIFGPQTALFRFLSQPISSRSKINRSPSMKYTESGLPDIGDRNTRYELNTFIQYIKERWNR